jgi:hypothetical protein
MKSRIRTNVGCKGADRKWLPCSQTDANDPSRKSSTPFAVTYKAATLPSGRAKLLSSAERWLDEATARHDTASTKFPAELRARYRNLSLRISPGKISGEMIERLVSGLRTGRSIW